MTYNELTLEQLENALDIEMETSDLITKLVKKSFEKERIRRQIVKIVHYESIKNIKKQKKSAA